MKELPKLILASGSPRRAEILTSVGWPFEKHVADIDESEMAGECAEDYVVRLACQKAAAVAVGYPGRYVLGADTTVVIDGQILAKPEDLDDARRMLRMLSGRTHEVLTGIAIAYNGRVSSDIQRTSVTFSAMSAEQIEMLVKLGSPLDKAGAYAVQAQAALFITSIDGDYWNVVGLPVSLLYKLVIGIE